MKWKNAINKLYDVTRQTTSAIAIESSRLTETFESDMLLNVECETSRAKARFLVLFEEKINPNNDATNTREITTQLTESNSCILVITSREHASVDR